MLMTFRLSLARLNYISPINNKNVSYAFFSKPFAKTFRWRAMPDLISPVKTVEMLAGLLTADVSKKSILECTISVTLYGGCLYIQISQYLYKLNQILQYQKIV